MIPNLKQHIVTVRIEMFCLSGSVGTLSHSLQFGGSKESQPRLRSRSGGRSFSSLRVQRLHGSTTAACGADLGPGGRNWQWEPGRERQQSRCRAACSSVVSIENCLRFLNPPQLCFLFVLRFMGFAFGWFCVFFMSLVFFFLPLSSNNSGNKCRGFRDLESRSRVTPTPADPAGIGSS